MGMAASGTCNTPLLSRSQSGLSSSYTVGAKRDIDTSASWRRTRATIAPSPIPGMHRKLKSRMAPLEESGCLSPSRQHAMRLARKPSDSRHTSIVMLYLLTACVRMRGNAQYCPVRADTRASVPP